MEPRVVSGHALASQVKCEMEPTGRKKGLPLSWLWGRWAKAHILREVGLPQAKAGGN